MLYNNVRTFIPGISSETAEDDTGGGVLVYALLDNFPSSL